MYQRSARSGAVVASCWLKVKRSGRHCMFTSRSRGHVTIFRKFLSGAALGFVLLSGSSAEAAFTAKLQAQSFGNTNWSTASATGWSGGDLVPTRVLMTAGPAAGQTINV